jgi:hypothetical protein
MRFQEASRNAVTSFLRAFSSFALGAPGHRTGIRIIRAFRHAGAVSRSTAQRYRPSNEDEAEVFRGLLAIEIIKQTDGGRFFLNQEGLNARLDWQLLDAWLGWRLPR